MHTQIGLIAEMLQTLEENPRRCRSGWTNLADSWASLPGICALVFIMALLNQTKLG